MMNSRYHESYDEFLRRIFSFQNPNFSFGIERLEPSGSVNSKVYEDGNFKNFIGDTVVFDLEKSQKQLVWNHYVEPLYRVAGECFAKRFDEDTIHMTLHDLNSSAQYDNDVMQKMFMTEIELAKKLRDRNYMSEHIQMVTTCVFNMVNTSLVLGLRPKTQDDYYRLMELYYFVEEICPLPYPFTPHITLAYYSSHGFHGASISVIEKIVNEMNEKSFEITISTAKLYYQKFINMNEFFNIMPFTK